uniref:C2H2-type domain-containing protein n=1 Tax=Compsopogon caeruleus TaxID=31354 RepID=A0A7S1T7M4_9RHOD|mmetsp:Transcript_12293/g.25099  ORF Transcript_12293/g.25099 Transcript_12293/m.25099 type:complete len:284 (+) Transcript_12293:274-1125(+)|eukprot:CAMPEP_0184679184 /NCGR_PEP_ID=MMETSP0312-20130426/2010_1 /TAXON_ID=31354 /ORGANISM="Compsopogon coeruleus, Strain SAG 36.94" /LENGTH=283 /DNA_ID=CAMNT_0027128473 /DNA_START=159 /DNA_END=1010 /DNA_ORIENTATION=+
MLGNLLIVPSVDTTSSDSDFVTQLGTIRGELRIPGALEFRSPTSCAPLEGSFSPHSIVQPQVDAEGGIEDMGDSTQGQLKRVLRGCPSFEPTYVDGGCQETKRIRSSFGSLVSEGTSPVPNAEPRPRLPSFYDVCNRFQHLEEARNLEASNLDYKKPTDLAQSHGAEQAIRKDSRMKVDVLVSPTSTPSPSGVTCDHCGSTFKKRANLKRHISTVHGQQKDFQCPVCIASFSQKAHRDRHIRTVHVTEKKFTCSICDRAFTLRFSMLRHRLRFHPDAPAMDEM